MAALSSHHIFYTNLGKKFCPFPVLKAELGWLSIHLVKSILGITPELQGTRGLTLNKTRLQKCN